MCSTKNVNAYCRTISVKIPPKQEEIFLVQNIFQKAWLNFHSKWDSFVDCYSCHLHNYSCTFMCHNFEDVLVVVNVQLAVHRSAIIELHNKYLMRSAKNTITFELSSAKLKVGVLFSIDEAECSVVKLIFFEIGHYNRSIVNEQYSITIFLLVLDFSLVVAITIGYEFGANTFNHSIINNCWK